jgi:hypothetical protein
MHLTQVLAFRLSVVKDQPVLDHGAPVSLQNQAIHCRTAQSQIHRSSSIQLDHDLSLNILGHRDCVELPYLFLGPPDETAEKMSSPRVHAEPGAPVSSRPKKTNHACRRCRERKVKCSSDHPCRACVNRREDCVFEHEDKKVTVSER